MVWRTKVGPARPVEHATRDDAEAHIAQLRARSRAGAASLRVVCLFDPDGGVQLVDFAAGVRDQARALRDFDASRGAVVVGGGPEALPSFKSDRLASVDAAVTTTVSARTS